MFALGVAQQQIELAQGLAVLADRQVGGDDFHIRCGGQGELPEPFVVQAEAARGSCRQPGVQCSGITVLLHKPPRQ